MNRVFISCGQATDDEKRVAREICELIRARGFEAYLALEAQTLREINTQIIDELKRSDYYLLVNFCRDALASSRRGSLFSNQELAIAYSLGFERLLVVNQDGIADEGMLRYIGVNTERFQGYPDCGAVVNRAIERARWKPGYSRLLKAEGLRFSEGIISYGPLVGHFLYVDIHNFRPDIAALETTGRLRSYGLRNGALKGSDQRSPLKATGRPGYAHTIFPKSWEAFDLLCIGNCVDQTEVPGLPSFGSGNANIPQATGATSTIPIVISSPAFSRRSGVYLNNALDVVQREPLSVNPGEWILRYEFYAIDFPVLEVEIALVLPEGGGNCSASIISQELRSYE